MIRSATHSSYPAAGEGALDRELLEARLARERGAIGEDDLRAAEDRAAQTVVAEQSRAFVDIVTDGLVRWEGPISPLVEGLEGVAAGPLRPWFSSGLEYRVPVVRGEVRRRSPILLREFRCAAEVRPRALKMVLPGPVTFARLADDRHYGAPDALARDVAAVLRDEVAELAAAGCRIFHLDEPIVCSRPDDLPLAAETARTIFAAAPPDATTIFSTSFGDMTRAGSTLAELPGTHLGLDLVEGPGNWGQLRSVPEAKGLVLGLFDARFGEVDDASDVLRRLAPHKDALEARDVIVGPNAGLAGLGRDAAFEHLLHARYLVEALVKEWGWRSGTKRR